MTCLHASARLRPGTPLLLASFSLIFGTLQADSTSGLALNALQAYVASLTVSEPAFMSQGNDWPWLARDLPLLQTLLLTRAREHPDSQWPAAMAGCTGLDTLSLLGSSAPVPSGPYLNRLTQLELADPPAAVLDALGAATALQDLKLRLAPSHVADSSVIDSLPNLRKVLFELEHDGLAHVKDVLRLQRRLPGVDVRCEFPSVSVACPGVVQ